MKVTKENIQKRLRNWKTWVALFSLVGFLFSKFGLPEAKSFLDEMVPYIFTLGISLGIWSDHEENEGDVE
ncbi:hypothetical protein [Bacillus cereus]|uniref:hypothetical protein n=1 Tax=Bacillus cereus TaxID=1396 RepID=UPI000BF6590B|nr:hypothetical protein [Bacillus cereus]PFV32838.1 hypothetical protein COL00_31740 [Bacillus cereus]PGQ06764.1 hypothetical protein COA09_25060 [Bacillus cereus]PGS45528.1 hypothetical protein COC67_30690 [Bacillus cereus]PGU86819.1 hypothetical protein COD77_32660 [Bacillus cereus]